MQFDSIDYYDEYLESDGIHGCCLLCDDARPGCLCYDCKCRKCYWYNKDEYMEHGRCDLSKKKKGEDYQWE